MDQNKVNENQMQSAKKNTEWMELSKPSVAAREIGLDVPEADVAYPSGKALRPDERGMGEGYPPASTNHKDLREWCGEHEL